MSERPVEHRGSPKTYTYQEWKRIQRERPAYKSATKAVKEVIIPTLAEEPHITTYELYSRIQRWVREKGILDLNLLDLYKASEDYAFARWEKATTIQERSFFWTAIEKMDDLFDEVLKVIQTGSTAF